MPAPLLIPLAAAALPAIIQGATALGQKKKADEMQEDLGPRVNYQIPEEAKKALALYQNMAVSRTMPGQQLMQNMIDMQQAKALGQMSRVGNAQDAAGLIQSLGEKSMEQQQEIGLAAAQNYTQRQQDLARAYGTMAGYQEKVTADKQQDWYERANAAQEMEEAWRRNLMGAAQGIGQMGMMAAMGQFKTTTPTTTTTTTPGGSITTPTAAALDPRLIPSMTRSAAPMYGSSFGMNNRMGKNPEMWDYYEQPDPLVGFSKPDLSRTTGGYGNNNFNAGFFGADLFNPIY